MARSLLVSLTLNTGFLLLLVTLAFALFMTLAFAPFMTLAFALFMTLAFPLLVAFLRWIQLAKILMSCVKS
jgi:hypothetical protein